MRTDSVNLSEKFRGDAADWLQKNHAESYEGPRTYKTKSKGAQEAHEAIRPTEALRTPESIKSHLEERAWKLYDLIWRRAVASQMKDAEIETTGVNVGTSSVWGFRATGSVVVFPGFLHVYQTDSKDNLLPRLTEGDKLNCANLEPKQHFTEPAARYSEATLVKALEERGIGRPSTYAPTISTIVDRGYVEKEERRLKPTDTAFAVTDLLVAHFPTIVDYDFTAKMEDEFDNIAEGKIKWPPVIREFYVPFHENLLKKEKEIVKTDEPTNVACEKCGKLMNIKIGRFGKFMACSGYPECKSTKPLPGDKGMAEAPTTDEKCEACGAPMQVKRGRFGFFLSCSRYPDCKTIKKILKKTGAKCPKCNEGDIVEKRTKTGRNFFACSRYPDCEYAMWQKPTGEKCPKCGSLLVFAKEGKVMCSNKECDFTKAGEGDKNQDEKVS
jgi:DNA topoisomerase-1